MTLRQFTIDDAPIILSWIKDKTAFRKWSADRYPVYPPKPEDMVAQYESDVIFPFTAIDDEGKVVGHIILRYPDSSKTVIRFGFVIVDDQLRGNGYGKQRRMNLEQRRLPSVSSTTTHQPSTAMSPLGSGSSVLTLTS